MLRKILVFSVILIIVPVAAQAASLQYFPPGVYVSHTVNGRLALIRGDIGKRERHIRELRKDIVTIAAIHQKWMSENAADENAASRRSAAIEANEKALADAKEIYERKIAEERTSIQVLTLRHNAVINIVKMSDQKAHSDFFPVAPQFCALNLDAANLQIPSIEAVLNRASMIQE